MNSNSVPMEIFINVMYGGNRFPLMVKSSDTILSVKVKISDEEGIPVHQQRLFFDGKPVDDRKTLAHYNIQEKSTIDAKDPLRLFHLRFNAIAD